MSLILIVEDEPLAREGMTKILQKAGYQTVVAEHGKEAIDLLPQKRPDLILCDINMPVMDGYEVLTELRKMSPEYAAIPFVFLTALGEEFQVVAGRAMGADDYLAKPVRKNLLLASIKANLEKVQRLREMLAQQSNQAQHSASAWDNFNDQGILLHRGMEVLYANQRFAEMFGFRNGGEVTALQSVSWLLGEDEQAKWQELVARAQESDRPVYVERQACYQQDGTPQEMHVMMKSIEWNAEQAVQSTFVKFWQGVSHSPVSIPEWLDRAPVGVLQIDEHGKVLQANHTLRSWSGMSAEQLYQQTEAKLFMAQTDASEGFQHRALMTATGERLPVLVRTDRPLPPSQLLYVTRVEDLPAQAVADTEALRRQLVQLKQQLPQFHQQMVAADQGQQLQDTIEQSLMMLQKQLLS
jgi:PAS domain S-box-containing protein